MLVQDTLTGYLHEVPDSQAYGAYLGELPEQTGEVVYDGLGNPVGLAFLAPLAAKLAPMALKRLPGIFRGVKGAIKRFVPVARAVQRALPGAIQQFVPAARAFQQALPGVVQQFAPAAQAFQQAVPAAVQQFAPAAQAFQQPLPGPMPGPAEETEFAEIPYPMLTAPVRRPPPPGWIPTTSTLHGSKAEAGLHEVPDVAWAERSGTGGGGSNIAWRNCSFCAVALQRARGIRRVPRRIGGRRR